MCTELPGPLQKQSNSFYITLNSSIIIVHPSFIIIKNGEGRSTKLGRWTGLDRVKGKSCLKEFLNLLDLLQIFKAAQIIKSGVLLNSSSCCFYDFVVVLKIHSERTAKEYLVLLLVAFHLVIKTNGTFF
jgi:hypothetical protein